MQAENRLAKVIKSNEDMTTRIFKYEKLRPSHYSLADMSIEEIISQLPKVADGPYEVFELCERYFGQDCFVNIVSNKMGFADVREFR